MAEGTLRPGLRIFWSGHINCKRIERKHGVSRLVPAVKFEEEHNMFEEESVCLAVLNETELNSQDRKSVV